MVVAIDNAPDPEKNLIKIKFLTELQPAGMDGKNRAARHFIKSGLKLIHGAFESDSSMTEELQSLKERLQAAIEVIEEKKFIEESESESVAVEALLKEVFQIDQSSMKMKLGQAAKFLPPDKAAELGRGYDQLLFGANFLTHRLAGGGGTSPWTIKEDDFLNMSSGQGESSAFTLPALFGRFVRQEMSLTDKLVLAYKLASARQRLSLSNMIAEIGKTLDKFTALSPAARALAGEHLGKDLKDPEEKGLIHSIFQ